MSKFATRLEMKVEAVERLKLLGVNQDVIRAFTEDDFVTVTDSSLLLCSNMKLTSDHLVKTLDKKFNVLSYLIVMDYSCGISMDARVSVSADPDNWESERKALLEFINLLRYPVPEGECLEESGG